MKVKESGKEQLREGKERKKEGEGGIPKEVKD